MKKRTGVFLVTLIFIFLVGCAHGSGNILSEGIENNQDGNNIDEKNTVKHDETKEIATTVINWAFPEKTFEESSKQIEQRVNSKLEKDGYSFRLKCVFYDRDNYVDIANESDADIVYTHMRNSDSGITVYPAYIAASEGKYLKLDEYLKDSKLYDFFHPIQWDSLRLEGSVYCVPNGNFSDSGLTIVLNKNKYSYDDVNKLDDKLSGLLSLISADNKLLYETYDFSFLDMYDIPNCYDGWAIWEGKYVSVLNLDITLEWIGALDSLRNEGKILAGVDVERVNPDEWAIGMLFSNTAEKLNDDEYWKVNYKGDMNDNFSGAMAIRATSKHPKEAFELMQLLMTDPEYGNLIIFGEDYEVDEDGYAINPETGAPYYVFMLKTYWGINTGLDKGIGDLYIFSDAEERKAYYEEHLRPMDMGYLNYSAMIDELNALVKRYKNLLDYSKKYTENNYDDELANWVRRSKEVVETMGR